MKTISAALKVHMASQRQTMATCWLARLRNGNSYGFTDHDEPITVSGWSAPDNILNATYEAESGFSGRAIATSDALNVDTTETHGVLVSPAITEDDLNAGRWDFARIYIFQVNYNDLTMGPHYQRVGWLGEVQTGRSTFKADLRGLMQLYTRNLIELTSPMCRASFGDAMCGVDLVGGSPSLTFTAQVDSVNDDNQTIRSNALNQAGPSAGVAVTNISNANPGVVTLLDDSLGLAEGQIVSIYDVAGMLPINALAVVHNPVDNTFDLGIDTTNTTDYPPYAGGGTVVPLGSGSGFFTYGTLTFLTGANEGIAMEVKDYVPGQVTLALPMPFPISAGSPQDTFTITAGCDKAYATCRDRFFNLARFRGEPFVRGWDKMIQVGRKS